MKRMFYPQLAWDSIRKNKQLYVPYILTCIGMVMMYNIITGLALANTPEAYVGGEYIGALLGMGGWVIALFSCIFLFYTNSFLMRRRKKEFGLYNILGMSKWSIVKILFWETLIISVISLTVGLILGILLSKLAELGLMNIQLPIYHLWKINRDDLEKLWNDLRTSVFQFGDTTGIF